MDMDERVRECVDLRLLGMNIIRNDHIIPAKPNIRHVYLQSQYTDIALPAPYAALNPI